MKKKFILISSLVLVVAAIVTMAFVFGFKNKDKINISLFYPVDQSIEKVTINSGDEFYDKLKVKSFDGYSFVGWFLDDEFQNQITDKIRLKSSRTLIAAYAQNVNLKTTNINLVRDKFLNLSGGNLTNQDVQTLLNKGVIYLNIENCTIDENVKFSSENLRYVSLPQNVALGDRAFFNCFNLEKIDNLDKVKNVGSMAFYNCKKLKFVNLENALSLGEKAFEGSAVEEIFIGKSLNNIDNKALYNSSIKKIILGDDNLYYSYENGILYSMDHQRVLFVTGEASKNIQLDERVKTIEPYAFYNSCVESIKVDSIENIGESAFENCLNLRQVEIANSTNYQIGKKAFYNCKNLQNISLGQGLNKIDDYAFSNCSKLEEVVFNTSTAENISNLEEIREGAFKNCSSLKTFTLPDSVTYLGEYALQGCSKLNRVTLSLRLSEIKEKTFSSCINLEKVTTNGAIEKIGNYAFEDCQKLNDIGTLQNAGVVNKGAFKNCGLESINFDNVKIIEDDAFFDCQNLNEAKFKSATQIKSGAFYKTAIKEFEISSTLEIFEEDAFLDSLVEKFIGQSSEFITENGVLYNFQKNAIICYPYSKKDTTFTILRKISKISSTGFFLNNNLQNIIVENNNTSFEAENGILYEKGKQVLLKFPNKEQENVSLISTVVTIRKNAFANNTFIKDLTLEGVSEIEQGALLNMKIEKLTIPFVGENISENKFLGYIFGADSYIGNDTYIPESLKRVIVTNENESLGEYSFYSASKLEYIELNKKVNLVEKYAFYNLDSLKEICFNGSIVAFEDFSLSNLQSLSYITLGYNPDLTISANAINNLLGSISVNVNVNKQSVTLQQKRQLKDKFNSAYQISSSWKWYFV